MSNGLGLQPAAAAEAVDVATKPSKGLHILKGVGKVLDPIGSIVNAVSTWYGMNKQIEENKKAREENRRLYQMESAIEQERFAKKHGLAVMELGMAARERRMARKERKEQRRFNRSTDFLNRFTNLINSSPQLRMGMVNLWR